MNYKAKLSQAVAIKTYSPRQSGEKAASSQWQEIAYKTIPFGFSERVAFINKLTETQEVWIKTATKGGRIRIFVKK